MYYYYVGSSVHNKSEYPLGRVDLDPSWMTMGCIFLRSVLQSVYLVRETIDVDYHMVTQLVSRNTKLGDDVFILLQFVKMIYQFSSCIKPPHWQVSLKTSRLRTASSLFIPFTQNTHRKAFTYHGTVLSLHRASFDRVRVGINKIGEEVATPFDPERASDCEP